MALCFVQFNAAVPAQPHLCVLAVSQVYSPSEMAMVRCSGKAAPPSTRSRRPSVPARAPYACPRPALFIIGGTQPARRIVVAGLVLSAITIALSFRHGGPPANPPATIPPCVIRSASSSAPQWPVTPSPSSPSRHDRPGIVVALPLYLETTSPGQNGHLLSHRIVGVLAGSPGPPRRSLPRFRKRRCASPCSRWLSACSPSLRSITDSMPS